MSSLARSNCLRRGRFSEPGRIYLLTTVLRDRSPVFGDLFAARLLVKELRLAHDQGWVSSCAWVIMPDHLHWLVQLRELPLSQVVRLVKGRSARSINRYLGRAGALWQDGYHDRALRHTDNIQAAARYLVANPLRSGLVERIEDYAHWDAIWL